MSNAQYVKYFKLETINQLPTMFSDPDKKSVVEKLINFEKLSEIDDNEKLSDSIHNICIIYGMKIIPIYGNWKKRYRELTINNL